PRGAPRHPQPKRAAQLLREAGFGREAGTWTRDGRPLSLALASPGEQEPYASVAEELSRQLVDAGIEVRDVEPESARELYNHYLAPGDSGADAMPVDIAVVPQPVSADPASTLASSFGCAPAGDPASGVAGDGDEGTDGDSGESAPPTSTSRESDREGGGESDQGAESTEGAENTEDAESAESTESAEGNDSESEELRSANVAGYCDPSLQPFIEDALTGATPLSDALATAEPSLWHAGVTIPLFQPVDTVAVSTGVEGVRTSEHPTDPFRSA